MAKRSKRKMGEEVAPFARGMGFAQGEKLLENLVYFRV
jgi:hypothetical protein